MIAEEPGHRTDRVRGQVGGPLPLGHVPPEDDAEDPLFRTVEEVAEPVAVLVVTRAGSIPTMGRPPLGTRVREVEDEVVREAGEADRLRAADELVEHVGGTRSDVIDQWRASRRGVVPAGRP